MAQKYLARTAEVVPIFDRQLNGQHRFLAGGSLTVADLYLYPLYAYFPDVAELKAIADKAAEHSQPAGHARWRRGRVRWLPSPLSSRRLPLESAAAAIT